MWFRKELINHDSYLESLKDIISNLDSTIINNSSSSLYTSSINLGNLGNALECQGFQQIIICVFLEFP